MAEKERKKRKVPKYSKKLQEAKGPKILIKLQPEVLAGMELRMCVCKLNTH